MKNLNKESQPMRLLLTAVLLISFSQKIQSQTYKFGDVPKEQLEMKVYAKDSSANAVVLFSQGESELKSLQGRFTFTIKRHIRVKILTDEGLERGDIKILFRDKRSNYPQNINKLKAESYTLDSNGKIIKESVGRRDRFEEEVSNVRSELRFTIPGLKKGSVFEYSYELSSDYPLDFPDWIFQDDIPVQWSEYTAKIPEWFEFLTVTRGYHEFFINQSEDYKGSIAIPARQERIFNGSNVSFRTIPGGLYEYEGTEYHYVMKDIPALKEEPYMKASIDYLAHIRFQLTSLRFRESFVENYLDNWFGLVNRLIEDEDFGKRLTKKDLFAEVTDTVTNGISADLEKMVSIYNHVSNHLDWNDKYGLYAFEDLSKVYEEGTGNGTSINLILVKMLREAGFEAHPLILSTRANGEIINLFPLLGQFNHTIAYVQFDDSYYLLDAKNELRPYNLLPAEVLNGEGLIIYEDQVIWVPIENQVKNNRVSVMNLVFNNNGYNGTLTSKNQGFYAVDFRNDLEFDDLKASVNEEVFYVSDQAFKVDSVSITNDRLDQSFDFTADFSSSKFEGDDLIYFNPMLLGRIDASPFTNTKRTFPVDYSYSFTESIIMNIQVPDGWQVDEVPESVLYRLPEQSGEFRRIIRVNGNMISFNYRFQIGKTRFMPDEYVHLKEFYDQIVEKLSQNIVLKKAS